MAPPIQGHQLGGCHVLAMLPGHNTPLENCIYYSRHSWGSHAAFEVSGDETLFAYK